MKKIIVFFTFILLAGMSILGCKKEVVTHTTTISTTDTVSATDTSVLGLLTEKQWQVDTIYSNSTGPGTGTLTYARGGSSNTLQYDSVRDVYWKDGSADYFDNSGAPQIGDTWYFPTTDSTYLITVSPGGTIHAKIYRLDATHFNLLDSLNHSYNIQVYKY